MAEGTAEQTPVVVVGAGMAGLGCAVALREAGRAVVVLEAADGVGGRVRTDRHPEGFLLDRGYQVLLDAYPAVRRRVDIDALAPGAFDAGAHVWSGRRLVPVADPFRHPTAAPRDLTSPLFPAGDKLRLGLLAAKAWAAPWQSAREAAGPAEEDISAAEALWAAGFGRRFVDHFARGFWGGILLDPSLATSAGPFRFTLKMFLRGRGVLPAAGMQAMPEQLRAALPAAAVRLGAPVAEVVREAGSGRAVGVRLEDGEEVVAAAVVVATDPPTARRLTGVAALPDEGQGMGSLTVYLAGERDPGLGRRLVVDGSGELTFTDLSPLSAVQPSYAPAGRHLLAAAVVGERLGEGDDEALACRVRVDVARVLGQAVGDWRVLAAQRIGFAQFAQPPGIYGRLPGNETGTEGLFLASEATVDSSYNGAILSGEAAAAAVLARTAAGAPGSG